MAKSIKKNYLYNLMYQIVSIIIPVITAPYLARVLGVNNTGIASYTLSIVSYFIVIGSVGVASYGQREIAMHREDKKKKTKIFWELFIYKSITSIISLLVYLKIVLSMENYQVIMLILTTNILSSILDISWFYQGIEEYKLISIRNILVKIVFTISIFLFVKKPEDLTLYILLYSLSLLVSSVSLWFKLPKLLDKVKRKDLRVFSHTKNTIIYFLPQIATSIYTMLDKTMLGLLTASEVENGYYEQAEKVINISLTVITSLNTVMSPRMSYLYKEQKIDEIKYKLLKSMQFACLLAFPMCFGLIAIAKGFVPWFFGKEFHYVTVILPIFSPIIIAIAMSNCLGGQCLTPCGKRAKSAIVLWLGAFVNFGINLLLIPNLKSIGAVIASISAEYIIVFFYFYLSKEYISFKEVLKKIWKYILSSILMFLAVLFLTNQLEINGLNILIEVSCGILIYGILLLLLKEEIVITLRKEWIHYGKQFFLKRRN